jgi:phosphate transport system substrate-binding protein
VRFLTGFAVAAAIASASLASAPLSPARAQEVTAVTGAGSTFAFPILFKWAKGYQQWQSGGGRFPAANSGLEDSPTGPALDYEPIGSLAGTMRVKDAAVDFGASDVPLRSDELAKLGLGQFPIVIGGIVAVVNLEGVAPGEIKFTGPVLADIFLGKVQNWSDPAIQALNPGLKLPDAKIAIVRRGDGSGTTYNFTNYLSKASPEWKTKVGSDLAVKWPVGTAAKGNDGVAQAVRQTKNSIGYVEFAQALQSKLSYASIQNKAGHFVKPETKSFQAAAASGDWKAAADFDLLLTDAPGENAYPMVATVFVLIHKSTSPRRMKAALNFFQWSLDSGAADASQLGYVPLPETLVTQIKGYWTQKFKPAS